MIEFKDIGKNDKIYALKKLEQLAAEIYENMSDSINFVSAHYIYIQPNRTPQQESGDTIKLYIAAGEEYYLRKTALQASNIHSINFSHWLHELNERILILNVDYYEGVFKSFVQVENNYLDTLENCCKPANNYNHIANCVLNLCNNSDYYINFAHKILLMIDDMRHVLDSKTGSIMRSHTMVDWD